ncbi:MAG TPA: hypothetical protein VHB02_18835 [Acidimicrobiales bacterium]|nr:hypothetical protein [Acidimicrobiales bacterium]
MTVLVFFAVDPETVTQSPTATAEAGTLTICVKVVDVLQLTVTWPVCWFWTSIDDPVMAATEPEAPGNERPRAPADDVVAAPATVARPTAAASGRTRAAVADRER